MQHQQHVFRRAVVAVAAAVVAASMTAACGGEESPVSASSPTPAPTAPKFDNATVRACRFAEQASEGASEASFQAAENAVEAASTSDVAALRDIAAKYTPTGSSLDSINSQTGVLKISTWCLDHGLSKPTG
ncbi:hypothetical protein [Actinomadura yumaensis]|uniref:Lipoprotein n=1 Tax=Actinomadura yumaensis TaxID=111807 RepID=A0ABW2CQX4_9ACTN